MDAAEQTTIQKTPSCLQNPVGPRIIVIGAGPVGMRFIKQVLQQHSTPCHVIGFNGEAYPPYDRIKLTQLLTQQLSYPDIFWRGDTEIQHPKNRDSSFDLVNRQVAHINTEQKTVSDHQGNNYPYDILIIATGSTPHVPQVPGTRLTGVYTFRNMRDAEFLLARTHRARHAVVVGGGLLGLEAAKGLQQKNTAVTLVHQAPRLMNRQLDEVNAELLLAHVKAHGINVITNDGLAEIVGDQRATGIRTRSGKHIDCDTVVLCTGINPNTALAVQAGIKINKGIVVDRRLRTSARDVYAIGECSEFESQVYGLVAPGLEQAAVLADNLCGGNAEFLGSAPYAKLKILDVDVYSVGEITELVKRPKLRVMHYREKKTQNVNSHKLKITTATRSMAVVGGNIIGACGVGKWPELQRIRENQQQQRRVFPWQQWLFKLSGKLWFGDGENNPATWPTAAIVCQCNQVSRGTIDAAIQSGFTNVAAIGTACGAGNVCGGCQPQLQQLLTHHDVNEPLDTVGKTPENTKGLTPITVFSIAALIVLSILLTIPGIQMPTSVQDPSLAWLVNDKLFKQVSGFALLSITLFGLILSLRKRLRWEFLGKFNHWRTVHTVAGVIALGVLLAHTGAHLGEQLNRWLMVNYLTVAGVGAVLGILIAISQNNALRDRFRRLSFWFHVVAVWPLPILVSAHILSSYYF